jgi:hypothetical protein
MKGSVFPKNTMVLAGTVRDVTIDDTGCAWAGVHVTLSVNGDVKTECDARIALPTSDDDNPWARRGADWRP